jgi:8-oxo-dGTP diphosphatase
MKRVLKTPALPCSECGQYRNRTIAVDALIVSKSQILLIKRGSTPEKGKWALPGGHVDFDETLEQAVMREVKEETGLESRSTVFLGSYSNPKRHPKQMIAILYLVEVQGMPNAGSDAVEIRYFPVNKLPNNLAFDHQDMIEDYLQKYGKDS